MVRLHPGVPAKCMLRLSVQTIVTDADIPHQGWGGLLLVNLEGADMDIISIAKRDALTPNEFRQLNTLISTFDKSQGEAFAQAFVERLRGRKKSDGEVNILIEVLVELATNYVPEDRFTTALRKRWAA